MNILLAFPGFIIAFIIVLYYERKVRDLSAKSNNNVHFYVARDKNGELFLYLCKPVRRKKMFVSSHLGQMIRDEKYFYKYGLDINEYTNLKFEDEPVEVFLNLEN